MHQTNVNILTLDVIGCRSLDDRLKKLFLRQAKKHIIYGNLQRRLKINRMRHGDLEVQLTTSRMKYSYLKKLTCIKPSYLTKPIARET